MIAIRPATTGDVPAIEALLAPEIARGTVLPRDLDPEDFLVALSDHRLVGAVALTRQSPRIVELGSLVSDLPGRGLGRRLVEASIARASTDGYEVVMALTGIPDFFQASAFRVASHAPWITARQQLAMPHPLPLAPTNEAVEAAAAKSPTCRSCPRLGTCTQVLLLRTLPVARRQRA
jgi:amino-acid N-acetyltransferase